MTRHASYVPLSALTEDEQRRYLALLAEYKTRLSPATTSAPAFRAGIRQRILDERSDAQRIALASFGGRKRRP